MASFVFGLITAVAVSATFIFYLCKFLYEYRERKKEHSSNGAKIMKSLLEEANEWLDIMKGSRNSLPTENWKEIKTIPYEVTSVIPKKSKKNKSETYPLNEIRERCEYYFENIIPDYKKITNFTLNGNPQKLTENSQKIQEYQKETEKIIKMLEQAKHLLDENCKK